MTPLPPRPRTATAAAVLGFVTAAPLAMVTVGLGVVVVVAHTSGGVQSWELPPALLFGVPLLLVVGLLVGGVRLLGGKGWGVLAAASAPVAAVGGVVAWTAIADGRVLAAILYCPLPAATFVCAVLPATRAWTATVGSAPTA